MQQTLVAEIELIKVEPDITITFSHHIISIVIDPYSSINYLFALLHDILSPLIPFFLLARMYVCRPYLPIDSIRIQLEITSLVSLLNQDFKFKVSFKQKERIKQEGKEGGKRRNEENEERRRKEKRGNEQSKKEKM